MMKKYLIARELFEQNDLAGSLQILNECIEANLVDKQLFSLRARIRYKQQDWGGAMNDYASVLELESENQEARSGIEMTKNILGYFNPDMFNP